MKWCDRVGKVFFAYVTVASCHLVFASSGLAADSNAAAGFITADSSAPVPVAINAQVLRQATTDGVQHSVMEVDYKSEARAKGLFAGEWDYGAQAEYHDGKTDWGPFRGEKAFLTFGRDFPTSLRVDASAGVSAITGDPGFLSRTIPYVDIAGSWTIDETKLKFELSQDLFYSMWVSPGAVTESLWGRGGMLGFESRPNHRLRLLGSATFQSMSDENRMWNGDTSILYGISPDWPWIWAGFGAQVISFANQLPDYWTPTQNLAIGPRVEVSVPVYGHLTAHGTLYLNRARDLDNPVDLNTYHQIGFDYKTDAIKVTANYTGMGDIAPYGNWFRRDWNVTVTSNF